MTRLVDKCEWCGTEDREVNESLEHGAWLCEPCFLAAARGPRVEPRERLPTLRDLHPSRVFDPLPRRRRSAHDTLRAAMRTLSDEDRREVEDWIAGDEGGRVSYGGGGLMRGGVMDVPAAVYVPVLSGRELRAGRVECPFHGDGEQSSPSLQVYEDGWYCHGCGRGGSIINFAGELWGVEPRGRGFHEIRERLEGVFV